MAYVFNDAVSDRIRSATAPVTAAPFSIACWARSDDETAAQAAISIGDKDVTGHFWDILFVGNVAGDPIRFRALAGGTAGSAEAVGIDYAANTWYHVCGVETSSTSRAVFVNGGAKGTNATNRSPANADNVTVGADGNSTPSSPFSGDIAEAAVWSVALTDAEVAVLGTGVPAFMVRPASLVFYAPLVRGAIDIRSGNVLTITGATVSAHPRVFYPPLPRIMEYTPAAAPASLGPLFDARRLSGGGILAGRLAG